MKQASLYLHVRVNGRINKSALLFYKHAVQSETLYQKIHEGLLPQNRYVRAQQTHTEIWNIHDAQDNRWH